ncbi:hypothetical protein KCA24_33730, partial [Escherichia coli]|nr:hypothetical protein [Escherichia coli]
ATLALPGGFFFFYKAAGEGVWGRMYFGGLRVPHLSQGPIWAFSGEGVWPGGPGATMGPGSRMGKRICETKGCINFKQHVGNPNGRHSAIQIQYDGLGTIRQGCCQPVDL